MCFFFVGFLSSIFVKTNHPLPKTPPFSTQRGWGPPSLELQTPLQRGDILTPPSLDLLSFFFCSKSLLVRVRKKGSFGKGVFSEKSISSDSREFRDSRVSREPPDCGKQRRIRPFSRDSRESRDFRDSRNSASEKTPFVMTPFSGPCLFLSGRDRPRQGTEICNFRAPSPLDLF